MPIFSGGSSGGSLSGVTISGTAAAGQVPIASSANAGAWGYPPTLQLFDSTLGADAAAIDTGANGVAQTANHLLIVLLLRTTQAAVGSNTNVTLNNDSGANYDRVNVTANSTSPTSSAGAAESACVVITPGASVANASLFASAVILVPAYVQTTANKSLLPLAGYADSTTTDGLVQIRPTLWRSTAAVTRVAATAASGNLKAGSRMTIYGLL